MVDNMNDTLFNITVKRNGTDVYDGPWQNAPDPVRDYIAAAADHYGGDLLAYLAARPDPMALLMRGWSFTVKDNPFAPPSAVSG